MSLWSSTIPSTCKQFIVYNESWLSTEKFSWRKPLTAQDRESYLSRKKKNHPRKDRYGPSYPTRKPHSVYPISQSTAFFLRGCHRHVHYPKTRRGAWYLTLPNPGEVLLYWDPMWILLTSWESQPVCYLDVVDPRRSFSSLNTSKGLTTFRPLIECNLFATDKDVRGG